VAVANRRLSGLLGVEPSDLFHEPVSEVARTLASTLKDPARFIEFFEEACSDSAPSRAELFARDSPAGMTLEVLSAAAPSASGREVGRVVSFRDVTGREDLARSKQALESANADLETVNAALRQKTADLARLNAELRSLDQMKSALLANVSHELQTPLVSIKGYTDMILKGRLGSVTEEQRRGLEISLRNIDRLIGMIENLLSLARREQEMPAMEVSTFALWDLVEECAELVREQADSVGITLTTRYLTEDLMVKGDRGRISQVFLNLLTNAIKFNRPGGEASISVRRGKRGYLIVEVRDTGIGIPEESLERIFDRFYRGSEGDTAGREGTGLGLAIV
ncbi:MAG: sensor histidine kinase, partial [Vicinamibacteria bacterium]